MLDFAVRLPILTMFWNSSQGFLEDAHKLARLLQAYTEAIEIFRTSVACSPVQFAIMRQ